MLLIGGSPVFVETAAIPTIPNEAGNHIIPIILEIKYLGITHILGAGITAITGQLGSVMKESVNIAYTFARKFIVERYQGIVTLSSCRCLLLM